MPQTTGAMSWKDCRVEFSTDGSTWVDVRGSNTSIQIKGGDRQKAEKFTVDGEGPIVVVGKRNTIEITVGGVYTEVANEMYLLSEASFENATKLAVRWAPRGGTTGNRRYTSDLGYVLTPPYPGGDSDKAEVVPCEVTISCSKVTPSTIP